MAKSQQYGLTEVQELFIKHCRYDILNLFEGIHAREWISPATALWTIHSVLSDERMMEELDWFIHPIVNPDGFTFTHEHVNFWLRQELRDSVCLSVRHKFV